MINLSVIFAKILELGLIYDKSFNMKYESNSNTLCVWWEDSLGVRMLLNEIETEDALFYALDTLLKVGESREKNLVQNFKQQNLT